METIRAKLAEYGQEHLLYGFDTLPADRQTAYLATLSALDLPYITELYQNAHVSPTLGGVIKPSPSTIAADLTTVEKGELTAIGKQLIASNAVAVVTMAGGQGTRLGYDGPKGCFDVGIGVSLFGLIASRIAELQTETGGILPWYIMTSSENHGKTVAFFQDNKFFGLKPADVFFFPQGQLPLVSTDGKILLAEIGRVAEGPDGNGGVFAALLASGALADMEKRGIRQVFVCGIDNALVRPADPLFLGFFERDGAPCASKSVAKASPEERVGAFCVKDNHPCVIEYTELTPEMREERNKVGLLAYGDANIVTHLMRFDALKTLCTRGLPMHTAFKAIPHYLPGQGQITPKEPNAYKFESFIFDAFSALDRMAILQVTREAEFAPVKNATGNDSPATALALLRQNGY